MVSLRRLLKDWSSTNTKIQKYKIQETVDSRSWRGRSAPTEHDGIQMGEAGEGCESACFHAGASVFLMLPMQYDLLRPCNMICYDDIQNYSLF